MDSAGCPVIPGSELTGGAEVQTLRLLTPVIFQLLLKALVELYTYASLSTYIYLSIYIYTYTVILE